MALSPELNKLKQGEQMYRWAEELFPINRSLTGRGVRQTLNYLKREIPDLNLKEVPSGTEVFDWQIPREWEVDEAYIEDENGKRVVDLENHTLHLVGYSVPVDRRMSRSELDRHLHSLPDLPDAIPYITSYYKENWGFCLSHRQREELPEGTYRAVIRSRLFDGVMNYADLLVPGESNREILFSTYICHPSMANNELSGPVLTTALAHFVKSLPTRKYSYRFLFVPETIGAIHYLSHSSKELKKRVKAGFVLTCVGDERGWSFMPSRNGDTVADRVARRVLKKNQLSYKEYSFLERGSDERQYCAPGIDLPVVSVMRSKYREYPEYHTSLDDLSLISPAGLQASFDLYCEIIRDLEQSFYPRITVECEPQLGKRGLYPSGSVQGIAADVRRMRNLVAYADGTLTSEELCLKAGVEPVEGGKMIQTLREHHLLKDDATFYSRN